MRTEPFAANRIHSQNEMAREKRDGKNRKKERKHAPNHHTRQRHTNIESQRAIIVPRRVFDCTRRRMNVRTKRTNERMSERTDEPPHAAFLEYERTRFVFYFHEISFPMKFFFSTVV